MTFGMTLSGEQLAAFLIAVSFASGLNVYATVATLGVLARLEWIALPPGLEMLARSWTIGASAALFVIEFIADKIPIVDLFWNALQTFVRIPVAALIGYAATAHLGPHWQFGATLLGASLAFAAHGGKTAARGVVTASPEPFSNILLSSAEDGFAIFVTWFATRHPFIAAAIVLTIVVLMVVLFRTIVRAVRQAFRELSTGPSPIR
jgi:uncharacterized protein DUF4126